MREKTENPALRLRLLHLSKITKLVKPKGKVFNGKECNMGTDQREVDSDPPSPQRSEYPPRTPQRKLGDTPRARAGVRVARQALRTLLGTCALSGTTTRAHFLEWHCGLRASCPVWRPPSGTGRPVNAENHLIKHSREMPA